MDDDFLTDRTLYLTEKKGLNVRRDGPSLWIWEKNKAGIRVPARTITRVFVIGNIKMDAGLICLFSENEVPVTFMNIKGETQAITIPYHGDRSRRALQQAKFLSQGRFRTDYLKWLAYFRSRLEVYSLKRMGISGQEIPSQDIQINSLFQAQIVSYKPGREMEWPVIKGVLENLATQAITSKIVKFGLDPHRGVRAGASNFSFVKDICYVFEPEIERQTLDVALTLKPFGQFNTTRKGGNLTKDGIKLVVHTFEQRRNFIGWFLGIFIDAFFDLMRGTWYEGKDEPWSVP